MSAGLSANARTRPALGTVLVLLLACQLVATDVYLPALPQIASQFGGRAGPVQWTLTAFLLAFGLAQLAIGWRADRIGRRSLLLGGLTLYVAAAVTGALAGGLETLITSRVLLGMAAAACVIGARAVIRDLYAGPAGMGVMARSMTGMGTIGVLSPLAGGLVTQWLGWHWTLALVAGFGALAWLAVWRGLPETRAPAAAGDADVTGYWAMVRHPRFLASSLLAGISFSGIMCFLLLSPFVFIRDFGMSRVAYGAVPAACTLAFLVGTVICRRSLRHYPVPRVVRMGALLSMAGGAGQLLLAQAGVHAPWALLVPQCVYMLGHGIHQPCGQGGAVEPFPAQAGRAAAVSGCIITSMAFVAGQLVSHSQLDASATLVLAMSCISAALGLLAFGGMERAYRRAGTVQA
ncbi:multidrug effflux MFS transporter [Rugamonas apoptosis]|uniref:Bcr/CflA family efflux transporter n=1 Tax=Rugamonas apoptosis TaxID=2758570 RepID=A0A7W2FAA6_9BURK|nr:multidrug effflux MFS transporter [Rugamonas apoptosis]MBA5687894.1 multidrug effflux MFS transporter [Rugamonas apoptosis]